MLLIEAADDVGGDADKRAQRGRRLDRVLAPIPRALEHERNLFEIVHEELPGFLVKVVGSAHARKAVGREQLLQFLRERGLGDAPTPDAKQLDFVVQRRILTVVQCPDDIVRGREVLVTAAAPGQTDEVRCVQPRVLRVDRDEHLDAWSPASDRRRSPAR